MSNPYGKLPRVKRGKNDFYPKPKKAGHYLTRSDIYPAELRWDGEEWWRVGGDKCLRPKDISEAWGPLPGTERPTVSEECDQHREWTLLDAFSSPVFLCRSLLEMDEEEEDIINTLKRLHKEGKLRIAVSGTDTDGTVTEWSTRDL